MLKFKACKSSDIKDNRSALMAIGIAEIAVGVSQIAIAIRGPHALYGVGATFISLGIVFICRARQAPTQ